MRTLALLLALLVPLACAATPAPGAGAPGPSADRLVFAHYFTPYPLSADNEPAAQDYYTREYLDPGGEDGRHRAYGGLLRDRPPPIPPGAPATWEIDNYKVEILQAQSAGIDGFTVDILSTDGVYRDRLELLVRAAAELDTGFTIALMPDGAVLDEDSSAALVDLVGELLRYPSLHRLDDGRLLVSPFYPERFGADWWAGWMADLADEHGVEVAFVPCFLNYRASVEEFAPISHAVSWWGQRSPAGSVDGTAYAADAHERGLLWMQPVSVQDARPAQGVYDEANNSENLRLTWEQAIDGADWVQLVTWNDYAEGTQFAPSANSGTALLDITAHYTEWFRTGTPPPITRDVLYVSHRVHPAGAVPTGGQTELMELREDSSPARDEVEVLAMLTAPAEVVVEVDGRETTERQPAGVSTLDAPLAPGTVRATAMRDGATVVSVDSPWTVVAEPVVQDLGYRYTASDPPDPYGCDPGATSGPADRPVPAALPRFGRC
ncbi:glycoside hydrolase family 71 protein [Pseudonocardia sp.]|uniref:glycoside hydrolase family 71 protein n=1 Tax=Pseudonocardia sp. TaxID=60912 RepID=UPI002601D4EC|nr:glycoside hydrolase family 71 protein [Pseudonocardia sp.]